MAALPVSAISNEDSVCCMWVTMPMLQEGLLLMEAWGFRYKTNAFTWVKRWSPTCPTWFMGMGRWTRANAELCLLGTRGKPRRISGGVSSVIDAPRLAHSAKPPIVRDKIVQLLGDVPRVELFARTTCPGWVSLGGDIDGQDLRVSIPRLAAATARGPAHAPGRP